MTATTKYALDTPALIIEKSLLLQNIKSMQSDAAARGKQVRPHVKTHKCSQLCQLQIDHGAVGISAAKVSEAYVLAQKGIKNTLITSPVVTINKMEMLLACLQFDPELMVVIDSIENASALNSLCANHHLNLNVLIDIDPGVHRTGIQYHQTLEFAQALTKLSRLHLKGIQCYAGNLQHIQDYQERKQASQSALKKAAAEFNRLNDAGFACDILTGTGTGTYDIDMKIEEVTEIQPGSYTVMDAEYFNIGSADDHEHYRRFQPAMTLLSSIISCNHDTHVTCDAGLKALYQTSTLPEVLQPSGLHYDWAGFGDEHGKITADDNANLPQPGDVIELIVAHCDPTINLFDQFYIVEDDEVVDVWEIDMRGKSQ